MIEKRAHTDVDPLETEEWLDSVEDLLHRWGPDRVRYLLTQLEHRARLRGVSLPWRLNEPQVNSIPAERDPDYPGDEELEERLERLVRWNAMAMVVRANTDFPDYGLGGHIATFASSAVLYEVAMNHVFRTRTPERLGDLVTIQGHGSPGIYARAFLEGRLSEEQLVLFRQELAGGLPSYPHPWLMPEFWQFPSVSMGLGPMNAIYQARFNRYLHHRGLVDTSDVHVWAYLGDGEMDEPESRGVADIAAREQLDNLTFVVNCNLQRLDGPVRGNGSIVRELEAGFRGAGWHVIKVLWSREWDELFAADESGALERTLAGMVDGELQRLSALPPAAMREELFGRSPELTALVADWSDEQLEGLRRGGLDRKKVYAAYQEALAHKGQPTIILAHTVKGYGMGKIGHAKNTTHQQKKLKGDDLIAFRDFFQVPLDDEQARSARFLLPAEDSPERTYLRERRAALGGPFPHRFTEGPTLETPDRAVFDEFMGGSEREASTTMAFVAILRVLLRHEGIGKWIVPIIPDEARTFGMESFFRQIGIYHPQGQTYEPVDKSSFMYYRESQDGQILEEGINEAGATASFIAAGTSWSSLGAPTIPFYIYYSMFGFQRVGDQLWGAGDAQCRGFLLGATAGRTTLNGEGLQHQDGHSHLIASAFPSIVCYDLAYAYELAVVIQDGLRRMYGEGENVFYYLTLQNENYAMPAIPEGDDVPAAITQGLYRLRSVEADAADAPRVQLFGSGSILGEVLRGAKLLAERGVASDVWSATSYKQLRTDALVTERWNRLHPDQEPRSCHLWRSLEGVEGPFVAASDNVTLVPEQVQPWIPGRLWTLGTDGYGRSDSRERLRRHFEVDAESVALAALSALAEQGSVPRERVTEAMSTFGIDPESIDSLLA